MELSFHVFNTTLRKIPQKGWNKVPEMESKWNQYIGKESPEVILEAMKASAKNKYSKIVMGRALGKPG